MTKRRIIGYDQLIGKPLMRENLKYTEISIKLEMVFRAQGGQVNDQEWMG